MCELLPSLGFPSDSQSDTQIVDPVTFQLGDSPDVDQEMSDDLAVNSIVNSESSLDSNTGEYSSGWSPDGRQLNSLASDLPPNLLGQATAFDSNELTTNFVMVRKKLSDVYPVALHFSDHPNLPHMVTSSPNLLTPKLEISDENPQSADQRVLKVTEGCSHLDVPLLPSSKYSHSSITQTTTTVNQSASIRVSSGSKMSLKRFNGFYSLTPSYKNKLDQFRRVFLGTPVDTDRLLVDYSCALSKNNHGLLLQGRMYVTENWVCFYSKILQEQKIYLSVKEIMAITKEKTARLIPNAIQLLYSKNYQRFFFTSFSARDRTYAILRKVWENCRNHQSMSIDEIVQQVREIYGDGSLAMLGDDDTDGDVEPTHTPFPAQSRSTSDTTDDNLVTPTLADIKTESPHQSTVRNGSLSSLNDGPSVNITRPWTADDDHFKDDFYPNLSSDVPDVVQPRNDLLGRRCRTPDSRPPDSDLADADSKTRETHSASQLSTKSDRPKKRSKKRHGGTSLKDSQSLTMSTVSPTSQVNDVNVFLDGSDESVSCFSGHDHPGTMYANTLVPLSVDALFTCIFTDSVFFERLSQLRGTFDVNQSSWPVIAWPTTKYCAQDPSVTVKRVIGYTLSLKQRFGPRTCTAVEQQTLLVKESRRGRCYVVDAMVTNQAVPLCNCFCVVSRYCLLRVDNITSRLCVCSRVVYVKRVLFGTQGIIENTCRSALTDFFTALTAQLTELASELNDQDRLTGGYLSASSATKANVTPEDTRSASSNLKKKSRRDHGDPNCDVTAGAAETRSNVSTAVGTKKSESNLTDLINAKPSFSPKHSLASKAQFPQNSSPVSIICDPLTGAKEITYFSLRPDRAWLLLVLISLVLCLCLSMIYNRLVALEQLIEQPEHSFVPYAPLSAESRAKLHVMKQLTETMSNTLSQMQQVLSKVQSNIDLIDRAYSQLKQK